MLRLGFHLSIAKGFERVVRQGVKTGCECLQIFSRNPRSWQAKSLPLDTARAFHQARLDAGLTPLAVHLPYLPNLAAADSSLWERSVADLILEMDRSLALGADFIVTHPGHVKIGESMEKGLERVVLALTRALAARDRHPILLLETTSGQKGEIGGRFEELAQMIQGVTGPASDRIGVCLDTAHIWAAGYDLGSGQALEATLAEFDRLLGLDRLHFIHLNDSKVECGGRVDRHEVPGRGRIGARNLARLVRHPLLAGSAAAMEIPPVSDEQDLATMKRIKKWRSPSSSRS